MSAIHAGSPGPAVWPGEDRSARDLVRHAEPRVVRAIVLLLVGCFATTALLRLYYIADVAEVPAIDVAILTACLLGVLALQLTAFDRPRERLRPGAAVTALAAQAVLVYVPMFAYQETWAGLPGFVGASALLVLRPAPGWLLFAAAVAASAAHQHLIGGELTAMVLAGGSTFTVGLVVFGVFRLSALVNAIARARTELAEVAVAKERLRVARDLHDLLGYSFSAITLKSELARRLLDRNPARAEGELTEVLEISRQALTDVRAVASGYRELSLDAEVESARAVLGAADIDAAVDAGRPGELTGELGTALATVLREAVTNVLRHSSATRCDVTLRHTPDGVTLEIVNDGARLPGDAPRATGRARGRLGVVGDLDGDAIGASGSGLLNLRGRIESLGGTLTAGHQQDDHFRVVATLPVPAR